MRKFFFSERVDLCYNNTKKNFVKECNKKRVQAKIILANNLKKKKLQKATKKKIVKKMFTVRIPKIAS